MEQAPDVFKKIAIRDLSDEQKTGIAQHIIQDVDTTLEYRSQMFLSIIIATLGLLINATPVVIGAMIIAPIMRPIQGVAFAISTGNKKFFLSSLKLLLLSIFGGIFVAMLITWAIPLTEVTPEIASRTQPTLVDLGIAIASGVLAFLAMGYKKMAEGLAGVAMAASLVPPLGVIGIGIAFGSFNIGRGSSVLFLTNLIAIIISGIIIFYSFGFYPNQKDDLKRSFMNAGYVFFMLTILCIPLASSLIGITRDISTKKIINSVSERYFTNLSDQIRIESMNYEAVGSEQSDISLSLKVPQEYVENITDDSKRELTEKLSKSLEKDINLDVSITPITSVKVKEANVLTPEEMIRDSIEHYFTVLYNGNITLLGIDYYTSVKRFAHISVYTEKKISNKEGFKEKLYTYLQEQEDLIDILLVERQENYQEIEQEKGQEDYDMDHVRESFNTHFSQETKINNLDLIYYTPDVGEDPRVIIAMNLTTTLNKSALQDALKAWKEKIQLDFPNQIEIEVVIEFLSKISL